VTEHSLKDLPMPGYLAPAVPPPDAAVRAAAFARLDRLTKPNGALGRLEPLAAQVCAIQGTLQPEVRAPHVLVFAADHGAAARGVSAYPRAVTAQMVQNFLAGGAAINVLARHHQLGLSVIDAGVDAELGGHAALIDAKIRRGTRDYTQEPAMTAGECRSALDRGASIAAMLVERGANTLVLGEMGIGNTASATLLMHGVTGRSLELCVGRGTGLDDAGVARKLAILKAARARAPAVADPVELLTEFGGYEIAMLAGAVLAGAAKRALLVVDGFTVTVAAALAARLEPRIVDYAVFAHRSAEQAHSALLGHLGVEPLLDLGMRLGEGTGGAAAVGLIRSAVALFNEMATFDSAGVSGKDPS
jgi:nicotinate-nucleotide--dimethylbenzimidazole phosphoribosyltransferase